jgi:Zn finger protein HypA/HybF involved in hydrogenase expression
MGNISYKISIPTDKGFWGRECKSCDKYFKVDANKIQANMFCPYCGQTQPNDNLWTKEQKETVDKIAVNVAKRFIEDELEKMFKDLSRNSKVMTYKPGAKTQIPNPVSHLEKEVDSEIECPSCSMTFQVFGIFGFCPGCKEDNVLIYEANLNQLIQEIDTSKNSSRSLRHAYNDLVSTFEAYCKKVASKNNLGSTNFQNLKDTKDLFKESGLDIYSEINYDEKIQLKRVFEKRHSFQHSNGKITEKYTRNVPEDSKLLNTIAVLSKEEFLEGIVVMKKILKNITNKYGV